ncbi:MAG: GerMN domain-containing protein [Acidimicrobiia bacterium]|nr:GerMN domain-containing protein [Acidimicrobiia bacterium]
MSAALVVTACGPSAQDRPDEIGAQDVPFGLLAPPTTAPPATTTTTRPVGAQVTVFMVGPAGPVPVARTLEDERVTLRAALAILSLGPTDDEAALGLHGAVPPEADIRAVSVDRGVAIVAVDEYFLELGTGEQTDALAQIVFTATGIEGIERVRFQVDGEAVAVPAIDGSIVERPVTRRDYGAAGSR